MVALADEDYETGLIDWERFIPIGIDSIKTFFMRNKILQRAKVSDREINKETLFLIYQDEIKLTSSIMSKSFLELDEKKTGFIQYEQLKKLILKANLFSPKEINMILRNMKSDIFEYKTFDTLLYDVRFELARSRLMDTNLPQLGDHLI